MLHAAFFIGWLTLIGALSLGWRVVRQRELARERLHELDVATQIGTDSQERLPSTGMRRLRRRWLWVPWAFGAVVATVAGLVLRWSAPYVFALGMMAGLLAAQVESFLTAQSWAKLESQLADAIDIMVGAVGAGASVGSAIEAAISESRAPLRPYLEEISGRIRLGDDPSEVFRSLAERVNLETMLLFTSALSVHWEVGGKLTATLTTVGRTIRDRIEISRRIRSSIAQSQFSTLAIIGLTYFIAVIVWRNGPAQMEEFVTSSVGSWFVSGTIVLQAVGIAWMNQVSKPRF